MKKNIKIIPDVVKGRLAAFGAKDIVAGCTRQYLLSNVQDGALARYGIRALKDEFDVGLRSEFEPPCSAL